MIDGENDRIEQLISIERFKDESNRALAESLLPEGAIGDGGDEDDWNSPGQFVLEFEAVHTRHANIEQQAIDSIHCLGG
ncbi:MAG TPA: hypothetical protein VMF66_04505 [Candidatus Acidoferrum sp.]|nr:hypothetical protein [Candidatus Acidoferrum sp.]